MARQNAPSQRRSAVAELDMSQPYAFSVPVPTEKPLEIYLWVPPQFHEMEASWKHVGYTKRGASPSWRLVFMHSCRANSGGLLFGCHRRLHRRGRLSWCWRYL